MAGTCGYGEGLSGSINAGNFLTSCKFYWLASQAGLCSMEHYVIFSTVLMPSVTLLKEAAWVRTTLTERMMLERNV